MIIKYSPSYFHSSAGRPLVHRGVVARVAFVTLLLSWFVSALPSMRLFPRQELIVLVLASTAAGFLGLLIMYRRKRVSEILDGPAKMRYLLIPFAVGFGYLFFAILSNPLPRKGRRREPMFPGLA